MSIVNPLIILSPALSLLIAIIPVFVFKPNLRVVIASAGAYFIAILLKFILQLLLGTYITKSSIYIQSLFYGSLTAILEVGFAFLFALRFRDYSKKKAFSYGSMLAFWENGVLFGLLGLLSTATLIALQNYNSTLVQQIIQAQPILAYSTPQLLPYIGYSALERISSFLAHASWGSTAYYFSVTHSKELFIIILLGYIDALVPLINAGIVPLYLGELAIFTPSLIAFIISYKKLP
ncbi:MAG: hypothetical protein QXV69_06280 [Sulfolobaceae archaeon]